MNYFSEANRRVDDYTRDTDPETPTVLRSKPIFSMSQGTGNVSVIFFSRWKLTAIQH